MDAIREIAARLEAYEPTMIAGNRRLEPYELEGLLERAESYSVIGRNIARFREHGYELDLAFYRLAEAYADTLRYGKRSSRDPLDLRLCKLPLSAHKKRVKSLGVALYITLAFLTVVYIGLLWLSPHRWEAFASLGIAVVPAGIYVRSILADRSH